MAMLTAEETEALEAVHPATKLAFARGNRIETLEATCPLHARPWNMLSWHVVLSRLIQDTGRFAERYASDLFISWQALEKRVEMAAGSDGNRPYVLYDVFAIRRDGVDHEAFLLSRIGAAVPGREERLDTSMYRRIYVVKTIVSDFDPDVGRHLSMVLVDATDAPWYGVAHFDKFEMG